MLGFALGALCILALPKSEGPKPEPRAAMAAPASKPPGPRPLSTIEAVFEAWGSYAVWSGDSTEVALWNADTKDYSDAYEVLRMGDDFYFRSIPRLTRPVLSHGVPEGSPLEYTETARQREAWLDEVSRENMRALSEGVRQSLAPTAEDPKKP
jgi:hypothetical protein